MKHIALVALAIAGQAGTALADTVDGPLFESITMDRHSPNSSINLDVGFVLFDTPQNVDVSAVGLTVGGQFVNQRTGLGVYGVLPVSQISYDQTILGVERSDSATMLGNVELGGIFSKWMSPRWALVLHGGIALPTAEDNDPLDGSAVYASSPRYTDLVQRVPRSTWLRVGLSPMGRSGALFWRADLGVDAALDEDNGNQNISPVLRANFGAGIDLTTVHIMAEMSIFNADDDRADDDDTTGTLAIGARFVSGDVMPGIALILPYEFGSFFGVEPELAIAATLAFRVR